MAIALGLFQFFVGSKTGRILGAIILAMVAFEAYTLHVRTAERNKLLAAELAATEQESQRRWAVIQDAQAEAGKMEADLEEKDRKNADLIETIGRMSVPHDVDRCLDSDATRRLRGIGG
jgi:Tfp pilus assembly protein PilE